MRQYDSMAVREAKQITQIEKRKVVGLLHKESCLPIDMNIPLKMGRNQLYAGTKQPKIELNETCTGTWQETLCVKVCARNSKLWL